MAELILYFLGLYLLPLLVMQLDLKYNTTKLEKLNEADVLNIAHWLSFCPIVNLILGCLIVVTCPFQKRKK